MKNQIISFLLFILCSFSAFTQPVLASAALVDYSCQATFRTSEQIRADVSVEPVEMEFIGGEPPLLSAVIAPYLFQASVGFDFDKIVFSIQDQDNNDGARLDSDSYIPGEERGKQVSTATLNTRYGTAHIDCRLNKFRN